jgi:hypothetical protein
MIFISYELNSGSKHYNSDCHSFSKSAEIPIRTCEMQRSGTGLSWCSLQYSVAIYAPALFTAVSLTVLDFWPFLFYVPRHAHDRIQNENFQAREETEENSHLLLIIDTYLYRVNNTAIANVFM